MFARVQGGGGGVINHLNVQLGLTGCGLVSKETEAIW